LTLSSNLYSLETFEKCFPLKAGFEFKEGADFERGRFAKVSSSPRDNAEITSTFWAFGRGNYFVLIFRFFLDNG